MKKGKRKAKTPTPAIQTAIVRALRAGVSRALAAQANGIEPKILERWLERGRQKKGTAYARLLHAVERVENDIGTRNVRKTLDAGREG